MSVPRYATYKESSAEWLGPVPAHWDVRRMGSLFKQVSDEGNENLPILSVSIHDGVSDSELSDKDSDRKVSRSDDRSKYKKVQSGDLVYNMMRAWQGAFGSVLVQGMVSPAYVVARPTACFSTRFIELLLRTPHAMEQLKRYSRGITDFRLRLYWEEFKAISVIVPPKQEQDAIVRFLDHEMAKSDELVTHQLELIALMKEKRQAVSARAVTRGLEPAVLMKPSGLDWPRDVPAHWEIGPVKRFCAFENHRRVPLSSEERAERRGGFAYYGASGIIDWIDEFLFDEDRVLVSEDGANLLNRATAIAFVARGKYWVNNHAHILKPHGDNLRYWAERLEAIDLTPIVTGSAQPKLTAEALANLRVAVPPTRTERDAIEEVLVTTQHQLDALMTEAHAAITLLQERLTALISAAVTGKIDVRHLADAEAA